MGTLWEAVEYRERTGRALGRWALSLKPCGSAEVEQTRDKAPVSPTPKACRAEHILLTDCFEATWLLELSKAGEEQRN